MKSGFFRNIDYRIMLISDSHGKNSNIRNAVNKSGPFDMILHAGDLESDPKPLAEALGCPCYFVKGNCDYNPDLPPFQVIDLGKHRVFLTHGHRYFVNGGTANLEYAALEQGCDIAVYGHTHVPAMIKRDDITVVNPGSVSLPRQSPRRKTFMIMEIYKDGTVDFNLVEM